MADISKITLLNGTTYNIKDSTAYAHAVTNKGSAFSSGLYKITTNSEGHVTAATAVTKSDITDLGIPGEASSGGTLSTETETIGSAAAGSPITATVITAWSAGSAPTLGTAITADDITAWTTNTPTTASVANGVLTFTAGTAASLSYTEKTIPNVTSAGSAASMTKSDVTIPNISVTSKTVLTSATFTDGYDSADEVSF